METANGERETNLTETIPRSTNVHAIWRIAKTELSSARLGYGLIFLWMFGMGSLFALPKGAVALRLVIFFSYVSFLFVTMSRPQIQRNFSSLPVPTKVFGVTRVVLQMIGILVALAGASLAAGMFARDASILFGKLHWIFPIIVTGTCFQWMWFDADFANRTSRGLAKAGQIWVVVYVIITISLLTGQFDGLMARLDGKVAAGILWVAAIVTIPPFLFWFIVILRASPDRGPLGIFTLWGICRGQFSGPLRVRA